MTASTPPNARTPYDQPAWYDDADAPTSRHQAAGTAAVPTTTASPKGARRTVSARVAAAIGVVAFVLGVGLSMLTGPLLGGGPGGPGGPGGAGGAPGTSQQQSGTGASSSGTSSSGTGAAATSGT
jgi:hypothetical protein